MKIEIENKIVDKIVKGRNEIIKKGALIDDFLTRNEYNALIGVMETAQQKKKEQMCYKEARKFVFSLIDKGYHIYELCQTFKRVYNELKAEVEEKSGACK